MLSWLRPPEGKPPAEAESEAGKPASVAITLLTVNQGDYGRGAGDKELQTMNSNGSHPSHLPLAAFLFEAALAPIALAAGWMTNQDPLAGLRFSTHHPAALAQAVAWGLLATAPLLLALFLSVRYSLGPLKRLSELARAAIRPLLRSATFWQLGMISLMAGLAEEMLFRGWLQMWIANSIGLPYGPLLGLLLASLAFGVCHWISNAYFLVVVIAGLYFGILLLASESLLTPITAHAVYDFVALVWMKRSDAATG